LTEKDEAARDSATLHSNSGRGYIQKGDASNEVFCIDYKEYAESFGVSRGVWAKCTADALKMRKQPALKLVLGRDGHKTRLWVIDDVMFHDMYAAYKEKHGIESG